MTDTTGWQLIRTSVDPAWAECMQAAARFHAATGHAPRSRSTDPGEARLGRFLRTWRYSAKNHTWGWCPARDAYADEHYPQWRGLGVPPMSVLNPALDARFQERLADLVAFVASRGCLPREGATDPVERSLANWVANWRKRARTRSRGWTAERERALTAAVPTWRGPAAPLSFTARVTEYRAFCARYGHRPRWTGDPRETAMAAWAHRLQRRAAAGDPTAVARAAYLDRRCPMWRSAVPEPHIRAA